MKCNVNVMPHCYLDVFRKMSLVVLPCNRIVKNCIYLDSHCLFGFRSPNDILQQAALACARSMSRETGPYCFRIEMRSRKLFSH